MHIIRLLPNVLGNPSSLVEESFNNDLIEYIQYTKPRSWKNIAVTKFCFSGDHKKIKDWRLKNSKIFKSKKDR